MPKKDECHQIVKETLIKEGWEIKDDPLMRFLASLSVSW